MLQLETCSTHDIHHSTQMQHTGCHVKSVAPTASDCAVCRCTNHSLPGLYQAPQVSVPRFPAYTCHCYAIRLLQDLPQHNPQALQKVCASAGFQVTITGITVLFFPLPITCLHVSCASSGLCSTSCSTDSTTSERCLSASFKGWQGTIQGGLRVPFGLALQTDLRPTDSKVQ